MCAPLPAGTNTIDFTFSVSPTSPYLKEKSSYGYIYLGQTTIPVQDFADHERSLTVRGAPAFAFLVVDASFDQV
jgi:hypothetical protein